MTTIEDFRCPVCCVGIKRTDATVVDYHMIYHVDCYQKGLHHDYEAFDTLTNSRDQSDRCPSD